ncbi:MAG: cobalamin-binding protein [Candidatus Omnitrophica bacterium]|nr:cobalamin-binding protein [Candidatus Omnitrophota bacterium]
MLRRIVASFSLLILSVLWFSSSHAASDGTSYERIVSLAPSVTEILFALGAGDRVVGVTTYCDYPDEAKTKPKVGGYTEHNLEAIVSQRPDLVILTPNRGSKFTYEKLKQLGLEMMVVPFYSLDDLINSFELIGEKTGNVEPAKAIKYQLLEVVNRIREKSLGRPHQKVAFVSWRTPLVVPGRGTLENDVIGLAGGSGITSGRSLHYPKLSVEAFFAQDPDLIIDAASHGRDISLTEQKELVKKFWSQYPELRAVKSNQVYLFKENVYSVPGPRTVRLVRAMDAILDPETSPENEYYERIQF